PQHPVPGRGAALGRHGGRAVAEARRLDGREQPDRAPDRHDGRVQQRLPSEGVEGMTTELALRPSKRLEAAAAPIWRAILEHPYLKELADGTLPRATFREYVKQDWLYLQEFLRASTVIASRCPDPDLMKVLLQRV